MTADHPSTEVLGALVDGELHGNEHTDV